MLSVFDLFLEFIDIKNNKTDTTEQNCFLLLPGPLVYSTFQTPDDLHAPTLSSWLLPGNVSPPRGGYERKILNINSTSE